jgi:hypothetical protein
MRKEATVTIVAEGRDKGKIFRLREMSSQQAEAWAGRLLLALANHGIDVPHNFFDLSMAGLAVIGVYAITRVPWAEAKPLMDEMMGCIRIQPGADPRVVRDLIDRGDDGDDIEEVATRLKLREEVLSLHLGFSIADGLSKLKTTLNPPPVDESGASTETSAPPSAQ